MNVTYLLGAGSSHTYNSSASGIQLPLANDFFSTYSNLPISEDFDVRMGDIANYVRDVHGIPWERFNSFNMNVEAFMTELDEKIRLLADKIKKGVITDEERGNFYSWVRAYDQMIFLFAHVLNETQNGPVSSEYQKLLAKCDNSDTLVTLNWDTLLDRAMFESKKWTPDTGYGVAFRDILDTEWRKPKSDRSEILLLKLHGSTNWLVNYVSRHLTTGERVMMTAIPEKNKVMTQLNMGFSITETGLKVNPTTEIKKWGARPIPSAGELAATPCCFLKCPKWFRTYANRYRPGYQDLSYFFPPNNPLDDIPLMPLIVPPTSFKLYDEFKHVLDPLWKLAQERISTSQRIVIIGYSFPPTDRRMIDLLTSIAYRTSDISIEIVNPSPVQIIKRLTLELGIEPKHVANGFVEYLG